MTDRSNLNPVQFQVYPTKGPTWVGLDLGRNPSEAKLVVLFYGLTEQDVTTGTVLAEGTSCYAMTPEEIELCCPLVCIRDLNLTATQASRGRMDDAPPPSYALALRSVGTFKARQYWFAALLSWLDARGDQHTSITDIFQAVSHCKSQRKRSVDALPATTLPPPQKRQHPKQRSPCPYCLQEGKLQPWQHVPKASTLMLNDKQREQALQKAWMKHYTRHHTKWREAAAAATASPASTVPATTSLGDSVNGINEELSLAASGGPLSLQVLSEHEHSEGTHSDLPPSSL